MVCCPLTRATVQPGPGVVADNGSDKHGDGISTCYDIVEFFLISREHERSTLFFRTNAPLANSDAEERNETPRYER
jgi:hypothetical protein